jgi:hypothetical protein
VLGVAVVGALIVALQHSRALELLAQRRIPTDADDRAVLDSLIVQGHSGNQELAEYPRAIVGPVKHAANDAFSYAFVNGMRVGALVAAGAAVLGLLLFRPPGRQLRW